MDGQLTRRCGLRRRRRDTRGAVNVLLVASIAAGLVGAGAGLGVGLATTSSSRPAVPVTAIAAIGYSRCPGRAVISVLHGNDRVFATGRDAKTSWLQIRDPRADGDRVWVPAVAVSADDSVTRLPVIPCGVAGTTAAATSTTAASSTTSSSVSSTTTTTPVTTPGGGTVAPPPTAPPDTTPPTVGTPTLADPTLYENAPAPSNCVSLRHTTTLTVHASDASGIASVTVTFSVPGQAIAHSTGGDTYTATIGPFPTSAVSKTGPVTVSVRVTDKAGNHTDRDTKFTLVNC